MAAVAAEVPAEPPSSGVRNPSVGSACSRRRRCDPRRSSRRIAAASCNGRAKIHPSGLRSVSSPTMRMARLERSECNWYPQRSSLTCPGEELGGGGKARAGLGGVREGGTMADILLGLLRSQHHTNCTRFGLRRRSLSSHCFRLRNGLDRATAL